ncbi:MAG: nonstructural protein [Arizlama microvirus]|nr:MAG: nonstructural protein [Arizlama microvirus]
MKAKLFSIYDIKTCVHGWVHTCNTIDEAIRNFGALCMNNESPLGKFCTDYQLMLLGDFNDGSGELYPNDSEQFIIAGTLAREKYMQDYLENANLKQAS